jgi:hypothetical protein
MALVQALYMDQGADFSTGITLYADGGMVPLDMTGYTFKAQMRKSYMSSTAYTFTCTIADPASLGIVILTMSSSTTDTIKPGRYLYDIEMVDDTGYKTRPVEGVVIVSPQITQI